MANFRSRREIERLNKLAEGGEAAIYDYSLDDVIKLFHQKVNLSVKEQKVKFFISVHNQLPPNVIAPEEEVTIRNQLVGYVMKKLVGAEDLHMLVKPKYLASMHLSNKDVLEIMTQFGIDLSKLHKKGILVGDISDYNFQIIGKKNYFIDVDSYGVSGKFLPDAYTEMFTCPDSYRCDNTVEFSLENENYNFAVLTFYVLTRIHPFGGTYLPEKKMSILERMKKKISVIGKYGKDIKIPKIVGSWKWMSPQLQDDFLQIFENGKKIDITPDLEDCLNNLEYCKVHDTWYYSKFSQCPLCNESAQVKAAPVVVKTTPTLGTKVPQLTAVFSAQEKDCLYILSAIHYLNKNNQAVHIASDRKFDVPRGSKVDFSNDGKVVYLVKNGSIEIYDGNGAHMSTFESMPKTNYIVKDKTIYYVDRGGNFIKMNITARGNEPTYVEQVYKPLFEVAEDGRVFIVSLYPKRMRIHTDDYNFDVDYRGWINEYAIKYDKVTHHWLFVYQLPNGKYRTMVFRKDKIKYDDVVITYNAIPLSNIDFANNTIYDPDNGRIVGTNILKGVAKEFVCSVVDESSKLEFTGRGFRIYNQDAIYKYE